MVDEILELAKRRGFIWPSFEIYRGSSGFYDYGPLGAALKNRIENVWRRFFVAGEGYMEISSPTIGIEEVFIASGHVGHFADPLVSCLKCKEAFRADHLLKEINIDTGGMLLNEMGEKLVDLKVKCPACKGELSDINTFNLMFRTAIGAANKTGYLRPETAQNIFILFNRLYEFYRKKLPFGVSQLGRAYRNEISPRQGLLRLREFSQAEIEIFVDPRHKDVHERFPEVSDVVLRFLPDNGKEIELKAGGAVENGMVAHQFLAYHLARTFQFLLALGIQRDKIRFRQHKKTEMAHYACDCWDAEVQTDRYGWVEVVGIADRTDFDLRSHTAVSGVDLSAFIRLDTPRIERSDVLEPDMKQLGRRYRGDAGRIAGLIRAAKPDEVSEDGSLEAGGQKIPSDCFTSRTKEERVEGEKIIPHVIEPSFGIDRIVYCAIESAYTVEERNNEKRAVLSLPPEIAPYDVAVFSLVSKGGLDEKAWEVYEGLRKEGFLTLYDTSGTIGRRYARADEIGVPYAVTVDFPTLEDGTVTLRNRDTMEQVRVQIEGLSSTIRGSLG